MRNKAGITQQLQRLLRWCYCSRRFQGVVEPAAGATGANGPNGEEGMNGEEGGWASTQPLQLPPASGSVPSHEVGAARSAGFIGYLEMCHVPRRPAETAPAAAAWVATCCRVRTLLCFLLCGGRNASTCSAAGHSLLAPCVPASRLQDTTHIRAQQHRQCQCSECSGAHPHVRFAFPLRWRRPPALWTSCRRP